VAKLFKSGATKMSISETLGFPRATVIQKIQNFLGKKKVSQPNHAVPSKIFKF